MMLIEMGASDVFGAPKPKGDDPESLIPEPTPTSADPEFYIKNPRTPENPRGTAPKC